MGVVIRYFDVTGAGAADGTSYANRAPLAIAGTWSTIITGFNFSGADALMCLVEPGSYTVSATLDASAFANPPTLANKLIIHAASGGSLWSPPNPKWNCCQPVWDTAGMPLISSTNIIIGTAQIVGIGLRLTSTVNNHVAGNCYLSWCEIVNTHSASGAAAVFSPNWLENCVLACTGTNYNAVIYTIPNGRLLRNLRIAGNASATLGNRRGLFVNNNATNTLSTICVVNHPSEGVSLRPGVSTSAALHLKQVTIDNCGTGVYVEPGATNAVPAISQSMITNCGVGINATPTAVIHRNRLRNTTDFLDQANWPVADLNYQAAGSDGAEYVDKTGGDYRIKAGSAFANLGLGAGEEQSAGVVMGGIFQQGIGVF